MGTRLMNIWRFKIQTIPNTTTTQNFILKPRSWDYLRLVRFVTHNVSSYCLSKWSQGDSPSGVYYSPLTFWLSHPPCQSHPELLSTSNLCFWFHTLFFVFSLGSPQVSLDTLVLPSDVWIHPLKVSSCHIACGEPLLLALLLTFRINSNLSATWCLLLPPQRSPFSPLF